jgi:hypothetical protein
MVGTFSTTGAPIEGIFGTIADGVIGASTDGSTGVLSKGF